MTCRERVSARTPDSVVVLAPAPLLTVTIEDRAGEPDVHVHAGGQGIWQARMISSLGVHVVLCAGLGGETGDVLSHLIPNEDVELRAVRVGARNGAYVHDRRDGDREVVAQAPGGALDRHEQDELYETALTAGLQQGFALLSGPHDDRATDDSPGSLVEAMRTLRADGAGTVVVSRADAPALALVGDDVLTVRMPELQAAEPKGAGDSMTAGMVATLVRGGSVRDALRTGAACGALNVVHRGLGSGGADAVAELAGRVEITEGP